MRANADQRGGWTGGGSKEDALGSTIRSMSESDADQARRDTWQAAIDYGIDVSLLDYLLTLAPAERIARHEQALELVQAMRQAGIKHYGFDPRSPETPE
jgi:hypothetical protein